MKKFLSLFITVCIIFAFVFMATASGSDSGENVEQKGESASSDNANEKTLGDYEVEIKSSRMTTDYEGKKVIVITYNYKNNSDTATAFDVALDYKAFQDGVELQKAYILRDGDNYNEDNQTKSLKKGVSLDIEVPYELNDETTDVITEVSQFLSFDEKTISKTFTIKK